MPVLPDDALIMCLDDLPSSDAADGGKGKAAENAQAAGSGDDLASKNADLQAQLDEMTRQFANYRLAVEQTLDKRWHAEDDDSSSTSSVAPPKEEEDKSKYYWEGYANHGTALILMEIAGLLRWMAKLT